MNMLQCLTLFLVAACGQAAATPGDAQRLPGKHRVLYELSGLICLTEPALRQVIALGLDDIDASIMQVNEASGRAVCGVMTYAFLRTDAPASEIVYEGMLAHIERISVVSFTVNGVKMLVDPPVDQYHPVVVRRGSGR